LKYPKVIVQALSQEISDHVPLVLNTKLPSQPNKLNMFNFELGWLFKDGFYDMVATGIYNMTERGERLNTNAKLAK
jgi:hypothetical protein